MQHLQKAGALIIKDKKLMIVNPTGKPFFINPGGKYEAGETAEECLRRELNEELCVELKSCEHYKTYDITKAAHSDNSLSLELYVVVIEGEPIPSAEIGTIGWMSQEDFQNKKYNVAPSFYQYVPDLIKDVLL
ncbi:MAG: NUDIX domain-containing protein [Xanthomonadaceae bacterium]|nr:NUDIX domain-containing protein [Rhodospirillaceae bacterium]NIA18168.1 NUDIX domain-containing protein [Xanthomonadaceae bacterium]